MNIPANLKYTKSDEWFDPASGAMGLTDYAQGQLSDIVFVELLVEPGDEIEAGKAIASVESVKASAEIYAAASGKVTAGQQRPFRQTRYPQQRSVRRWLDGQSGRRPGCGSDGRGRL